MHPSSSKGNNPQLWNKLLEALDDRLQLGLLDQLRRVSSYHFEDQTLTIQAGSEEDNSYLSRPAVAQQLEIFAREATAVERVRLATPA